MLHSGYLLVSSAEAHTRTPIAAVNFQTIPVAATNRYFHITSTTHWHNGLPKTDVELSKERLLLQTQPSE